MEIIKYIPQIIINDSHKINNKIFSLDKSDPNMGIYIKGAFYIAYFLIIIICFVYSIFFIVKMVELSFLNNKDTTIFNFLIPFNDIILITFFLVGFLFCIILYALYRVIDVPNSEINKYIYICMVIIGVFILINICIFIMLLKYSLNPVEFNQSFKTIFFGKDKQPFINILIGLCKFKSNLDTDNFIFSDFFELDLKNEKNKYLITKSNKFNEIEAALKEKNLNNEINEMIDILIDKIEISNNVYYLKLPKIRIIENIKELQMVNNHISITNGEYMQHKFNVNGNPIAVVLFIFSFIICAIFIGLFLIILLIESTKTITETKLTTSAAKETEQTKLTTSAAKETEQTTSAAKETEQIGEEFERKLLAEAEETKLTTSAVKGTEIQKNYSNAAIQILKEIESQRRDKIEPVTTTTLTSSA